MRRENSNRKRRPADLPERVPEPRCGDIVIFREREDIDFPAGTYRVGTTSRRDGGDGSVYGFRQVDGDAVTNLSGKELAALWETDKSALWPVVYPRVDLMKRHRDPETDRISYYDERFDEIDTQRQREDHAERYADVAIRTEESA